MKIKEQTRKLAAGCSKHCFEVVDRTDEVSNIYTARRRWRGLKRFSKSMNQSSSILTWTTSAEVDPFSLQYQIGVMRLTASILSKTSKLFCETST